MIKLLSNKVEMKDKEIKLGIREGLKELGDKLNNVEKKMTEKLDFKETETNSNSIKLENRLNTSEEKLLSKKEDIKNKEAKSNTKELLETKLNEMDEKMNEKMNKMDDKINKIDEQLNEIKQLIMTLNQSNIKSNDSPETNSFKKKEDKQSEFEQYENNDKDIDKIKKRTQQLNKPDDTEHRNNVKNAQPKVDTNR